MYNCVKKTAYSYKIFIEDLELILTKFWLKIYKLKNQWITNKFIKVKKFIKNKEIKYSWIYLIKRFVYLLILSTWLNIFNKS